MDDNASLAALYTRTRDALRPYLTPLNERRDREFRRELGAALVEAAELGRRAERAETADEAVGV